MKLDPSKLDRVDADAIRGTAKQVQTKPPTVFAGEPVLGRDYLVIIVNMCDWLVVGVSVNGYDAYLPSPFGKTCSTNYEDCIRNGGYRPAANFNCRDSAARFQLIVRWPAAEGEYYTNEITITPTCDKIGVAIPMNIPAP